MDNKTTQDETHSTSIDTGAFEHAAIGLAYINLNARFIRGNKALLDILGYDQNALSTLTLDEIVHPNDIDRLRSSIKQIISHEHASREIVCSCFDAKGRSCKLRIILSVMNNQQGDAFYIIAAIEKLRANDTLDINSSHPSFERKLFETIAENVQTTVWLASVDFKTLHYANQAFFDIWQVPREALDSEDDYNIFERIHPDDVEQVRERIKEGVINGETWEQNFRILHKDGTVSFIEDHGTVLRDNAGKALYLLGTHHDVTERVQYTAKLEMLNEELQHAYEEVTRLNQFESLTGCYNRSAMLDHLSNAYYQFTRYEIPSTIIFIDLNHFKEVNDVHGHIAGDLVLKSFVKHMQKRLRQTDVLGRMGGDEFLLLFPGTTKYNAEQFLKKEKKEFTTKINDGQTLMLSYSVGIAELNFNMNTIDEWVDVADKLMYKEKALLSQK